MTNYQYLTYQDRCRIEAMLNDNYTIVDIANQLGRQRSTITNEIVKNKTILYRRNCDCEKINICNKEYICGKSICRMSSMPCSLCVLAGTKCTERIEPTCRSRQPHNLCNTCRKLKTCKLTKYYYSAKKADAKQANEQTPNDN